MGWAIPSITYIIVIILVVCQQVICGSDSSMTTEERESLKEEARDMFYHAYRAYMENAYPADELMPLSCQGRYRGAQPSRGDMDDILGNFSLTLIDTLDTLVILGDLEEFEHGVKLIIRDVSFDTDVVVSVFETNIRIIGGLLSGHILTEYLQEKAGIMSWYRGELLSMAKDLGYRLLPAFNTTTGIPYSKVNLMHGIKQNRLGAYRETCTACAGTMILEMAALSRLTGERIFEEKAHRAMDELWKMRHRSSDLMGTVLNVHSGDWIRRDSGVGAGIDSYYEYCLKAYILLGDERYLTRFNRHYNAVMKYVSQGPMLVDVHMHRPHTNSRNFMDALLAFWPGLQVLKGDIKPAVETHEMLYQVMQRHTFIPEAFTTDFQIHWSSHPLRPEFLESTYFLHRATNDPYYLQVGKQVLKSLQKHARVPCGYAAVNDVRTGKHEDRMDSFVLAETFKYLYLLFVDESDLILDLNDFIFTTEAHLLPLSLARPDNGTRRRGGNLDLDDTDDSSFGRMCPSTVHLLPDSLRKPLRNMVDGICPKKNRRRLTAAEFQVSDSQHLAIIKDMGINIMTLNDGRIQLLHSFSSARSITDAEEGIIFMAEMLQLSKAQADQPEYSPQSVTYKLDNELITLKAGPSHFGPELRGKQRVYGPVVIAKPIRACENIKDVKDKIVIMERGDCMFVDKARHIQAGGAIAGIVIDNVPNSSSLTSPFFAMSGDGTNDVTIPVVFLFTEDASKLQSAVYSNPDLILSIGEYSTKVVDEVQMGANKVMIQQSFGFFYSTYELDGFKISYHNNKEKNVKLFPEEDDEVPVNPGWIEIREFILKALFEDPDKTFFITKSTLWASFREYHKHSPRDLSVAVKWLLMELQKQYNSDPDLINRVIVKKKGNAKDVSEQLTEKMTQLLKALLGTYRTISEKIVMKQLNLGDNDFIVNHVESSDEVQGSVEERKESSSSDSVINDSTNDDIVLTNQKINDEL